MSCDQRSERPGSPGASVGEPGGVYERPMLTALGDLRGTTLGSAANAIDSGGGMSQGGDENPFWNG